MLVELLLLFFDLTLLVVDRRPILRALHVEPHGDRDDRDERHGQDDGSDDPSDGAAARWCGLRCGRGRGRGDGV